MTDNQIQRVWCQSPVDTGRTTTLVIDYATDPGHLEQLAFLIREAQWKRAARLAEMWDAPTLGFYRQDPRRLRWLEAT